MTSRLGADDRVEVLGQNSLPLAPSVWLAVMPNSHFWLEHDWHDRRFHIYAIADSGRDRGFPNGVFE